MESLRNLCVLCVSAVIFEVNRRDAEDAEATQRKLYSARNAEIGSTEAARRAGRKLANNADVPNTAATLTSVVKSHGGVPKSSLRINEAAMIAQPVPITFQSVRAKDWLR